MSFSDWVQKWINQMAHVGWGAYLVLALDRHVHAVYAVAAVTAFATIKEGVFDPLTETVALRGSGLQDWLFWEAGVILGALSLIKF